MREFIRFLVDFFDDPRRYAGILSLLVALLFVYGWASSLGLNNGFVLAQLIYGAVVIPLTGLSAWWLLSKPRTSKAGTTGIHRDSTGNN